MMPSVYNCPFHSATARTRAFIALVIVAALMGASPRALAERADRQKPINVESDRMSGDDLKQTAVFTGRVVVTQGTFLLCADKVTLRQDKEGNQSATAVGAPTTFREKRDGVDEWIEGQALRIEYDNHSETLELFDKALVNRNKDQVRGNYIFYDSKTEIVRVQDKQGSRDTPGTREGRVSAVFQPKPKANAGGDTQPAGPLITGPGLKMQDDIQARGNPAPAAAPIRPATCH